MRPVAPSPATSSLRAELIRGSIWMVGARWVARGIGVVSTAVLARLLLPADFGLVAMAWLVMGLLEICTSFGLDYALIRNGAAHKTHFDTAWTLRLIQSAGVALIAVAMAPVAARYFNEPRVAPLLMALAVSTLINGASSIGPVLFRKELAFAREFWFGLFSKLFTTACTLMLAWSLRNYWALVLGSVAGAVANLVLSYRMHPYRPRFCLAATREMWGFSQWMLLVNVGNFAQERADQLLVGRLASAAELGLYNVANEVASLPTSEVLFPMSRVLFPGFARLTAEPDRLRAAYFSVLGFLTALALPAGVGLALVADDFVALLLGAQWHAAVPFLQVLALYGMFRVVCGQAGNVLLVVGKPQVVAALAWVQFAVLVPALWWAALHYGVSGIVWAKLALGGVMGVGQVLALRALYAVSLRATFAVVWRPVLSVCGMALVLGGVMHLQLLAGAPLVLRLASEVLIGASVYCLVLGGMWWLAGRPAGAERFVFEVMLARWAAAMKKGPATAGP